MKKRIMSPFTILLALLILTSCIPSQYRKGVKIDRNFPDKILEIYDDAIVFFSEEDDDEITIKAGSEDDVDDVIEFYQELFEDSDEIELINEDTDKDDEYQAEGIISKEEVSFEIEIEEAKSKNTKELFTTVFEIVITPLDEESQMQLQEPIIPNTKEVELKILSPAYGETINNTYTIIKGTADVGESINKQIEIIIEVINSDGSTYKTQIPFGKNEFEIKLPLIFGENNLIINTKTLEYFDHYLYSEEVIINNDMNQDFQIICTDEKASEDIINLPYEETTLSEKNMKKLDSLIGNYAYVVDYDYLYKIPEYFVLAGYCYHYAKHYKLEDDFDYIYFDKTAVYNELYNSFGLPSEEIIKVQEVFAENYAEEYKSTDEFYKIPYSDGEIGEDSKILSVFSYDDYIKVVVELTSEVDWEMELEPRYALVILKKSETNYGYNLLVFKRYDTIDLENIETTPVVETGDGRSALYKIKTDGSNKTLIVYGAKYARYTREIPELSIIDGWIYYDHGGAIFKITTDGTDRLQLTDYIGTPFEIDAAGEWIYYINNSDGNTIYTMKTDGTNHTKITSDDCGDYGYSFSIEGEWIYYCNNSDESSLYKIKTDGTDRTKLDNDISHNISVADEWVYYTDSWISASSLYKIKTDGTNMTKLSDGGIWDAHVVDEWIYYENGKDEGALYRIKTDGTDNTKITADRNSYINVVGEYVYYINHSDGQTLYKIKIDGSDRTKIDSINSNSSSILQVVDDWIYYFYNPEITS